MQLTVAETGLAKPSSGVMRALEASRAKTTTRAYRGAWERYADWCERRGCPALPGGPLPVAEYLEEIGRTRSISTVRQAAAAIGAVHRDAGAENPCAHAGVRRVINGLARLKAGVRRRQARALTREAVDRILPQCDQVDRALVLVMRDAMLRRSEAAALTWDDIGLSADGSGWVDIRKSKTDQEGVGERRYLSRASMEALAALPDGPSVFGLSDRSISRRLSRAAERAGLGAGFSGHSARVGMAVDLVESGEGLPAVMVAGGWRDPKMPSYYARTAMLKGGAVARFHGESTT